MPFPGARQPYIGRFAPSPTGPLHAGSLLAAMGSYLDCLQHQGRWLLRIEDLDPPREVAGAADAIIRSLEKHGFQWSGPIVYQSSRLPLYQEALATLRQAERLYACRCSRSALARMRAAAVGLPEYPGNCREAGLADQPGRALRFVVPRGEVTFTDRLQGHTEEDLSAGCGDFVVRRRDGLIAYQLAVVVDDAQQSINNVVRGCDLLESTARQISLQQALGLQQPAYLHLPVLLGRDREKLSKQNGATALDDGRALENLLAAYRLLDPDRKQYPDCAQVSDFWRWAQQSWDPMGLLGSRKIAAQPSSGL